MFSRYEKYTYTPCFLGGLNGKKPLSALSEH